MVSVAETFSSRAETFYFKGQPTKLQIGDMIIWYAQGTIRIVREDIALRRGSPEGDDQWLLCPPGATPPRDLVNTFMCFIAGTCGYGIEPIRTDRKGELARCRLIQNPAFS